MPRIRSPSVAVIAALATVALYAAAASAAEDFDFLDERRVVKRRSMVDDDDPESSGDVVDGSEGSGDGTNKIYVTVATLPTEKIVVPAVAQTLASHHFEEKVPVHTEATVPATTQPPAVATVVTHRAAQVVTTAHLATVLTKHTDPSPKADVIEFYRVTVSVTSLECSNSLLNRQSRDFQYFEQSFVKAAEDLFVNLDGDQRVNIVQILCGSVLVQFDIGSSGFADANAIDAVVQKAVQSGYIGEFSVALRPYMFAPLGRRSLAFTEACTDDQMMCGNGQCISLQQKCDNIADCNDRIDEAFCDAACSPDQTDCGDGTACVDKDLVCDGNNDCPNKRDEDDCGSLVGVYASPANLRKLAGQQAAFVCNATCPKAIRCDVEWYVAGRQRLPAEARVNGNVLTIDRLSTIHSGDYVCSVVGAPGRTSSSRLQVDEPVPDRGTCSATEYQCANGQCIKSNLQCDGDNDCSDGSDERNCAPQVDCDPTEFRCDDGKKCAQKIWRCDGENECDDGSDERNCPAAPPGAFCLSTEFQCDSVRQCIPRTYLCEGNFDCQDRSDEIGCGAPTIVEPPIPQLEVQLGGTIRVTCKAVGKPVPLISWRLNWGNIPTGPRVTETSENGYGVLVIRDAVPSDAGAYTCEAINIRGSVFANPDLIVTIRVPGAVCNPPFFNIQASQSSDCISCFCFGVASDCKSTAYHRSRLNVGDGLTVVDSSFRPVSPLVFQYNASMGTYEIRDARLAPSGPLYWSINPKYLGNMLKSYGGQLSYRPYYDQQGASQPDNLPHVLIFGSNGIFQSISSPALQPRREASVVIPFLPSYYKFVRSTVSTDIIVPESGTRANLMMTLANVSRILIKATLDRSQTLSRIGSISMDSAQEGQTASGVANLVEQCVCPIGYTGMSCEECAPSFSRVPGAYRGECKQSKGSEMAECSAAGTIESPDGQCSCKSNVIGKSCADCRPGTFYLSATNPSGCQKCFCNGLTSECSSSSLRQTTVGTIFRSNTEGFELTDERGVRTYNQFVRLDGIRGHLIADVRASPVTYYWKLPAKYLGNRLTSYGGELRFQQESSGSTINVDSSSDVIINGHDNIQINAALERVSSTDRKVAINEAAWRRADGRPVDREHMLMALRDVKNILVKVASAYSTAESRLGNVYLDIADDRQPATQPLAAAVEQCRCPPGYVGLSCEDCAPGYRRASGLYWGICEPERCNCNGHASACDSTGACINCLHNTEGRNCERCAADYDGDATGGSAFDCSRVVVIPTPQIVVRIGGTATFRCQPFRPDFPYRSIDWSRPSSPLPASSYQDGRGILEIRNVPLSSAGTYVCTITTLSGLSYTNEAVLVVEAQPCTCNPDGSLQRSGVITASGCSCSCKSFVEGALCDRCKEGYFDLTADNPDGCRRCYCSGTTSRCSSSSLYRYDKLVAPGQHVTSVTLNAQLTAMQPRLVAGESVFTNFSGWRQNLFWSLPASFRGYQGDSYGGFLQYIVNFIGDGSPVPDIDAEILSGGKRYYHRLRDGPVSGVRKQLKVPIHESAWRSRTGEVLTREEFLRVLANVTAILIRMSYVEGMVQSSLSDVRLSGAGSTNRGLGVATSVERCDCPPEYSGLSCENCATDFTRTNNGGCQRALQVDVVVQPRLLPAVYGSSAVFSCRIVPFATNVEVSWTRDNGQIPAKAKQDGNRLEIPDLKPEDAGTYRCTAKGPVLGALSDAGTLTVQDSRIEVSVTPSVLEVTEGDGADFTCIGRSQVGGTTYVIAWSRDRLGLPAGRTTESNGVLSIRDVQVGDAGFYTCTGSNVNSVDRKVVELKVKGRIAARIEPSPLYITEGGTGQARCVVAGRGQRVTWTRSGSQPVGRSHQVLSNAVDGDTLRFVNFAVGDRGYYYCRVSGDGGVEVTSPPTIVDILRLSVNIDRPSISVQLGSRAEFVCSAGGIADVQDIRWQKQGGQLPARSTQRNGILTIEVVERNDEGTYVCTITTKGGQTATGSARLTVIYQGVTELQIDNLSLEYGQSGRLHCRSELPGATYEWARQDRQPLPAGVQARGGYLTFTNANSNMNGMYTCIVSSPFGSQAGAAEVRVGFVIITPEKMNVTLGSTVEITCSARPVGGVTPILYWRNSRGQLLTDRSPGQVVLRFSSVTYANQGNYTCVAEIGSSASSSTLELLVVDDERINFEWRQYPSNPFTITRPAGSRLELDCTPTSTSATDTQWTRRGASLPANAVIRGQRLILSDLRKSDEGTYVCRVYNDITQGDLYVYLVVESSSTAVISADSLRMPNGTARTYRRGAVVVLTCTLEGEDQSLIEWRKVLSDGRATAIPRTSNINVDGNKITINGITANDAGIYQCIARGRSGYSNSFFRVFVDGGAATVVAEPPSGIIVDGGGRTYDQGATIALTCQARAGTQPMRYQWSWSQGQLPSNAIASANVLTLRNLNAGNNGFYYCIVSNDGGSSQSAASSVQVQASTLPSPKTTSSANLQYKIGETVILTCELPPGAEHIEWARDGNAPLPSSSRLLNSGQVLEIRNIRPSDSGSYYCRAVSSSRGQSPSVRIVITVSDGGSNRQVVRVGDAVNIVCSTSGVSPGTKNFLWSRANNLPLPASSYFIGPLNSTLRIENIALADAGEYYCSPVGESGTVGTSVGATIVVEADTTPDVPTLGVSPLLESTAGSTVTLRCDTSESGVEIVWRRGGNLPLPANSVRGARTLIIPNISPDDGGVYYCAARSSAGTSPYIEIRVTVNKVALPQIPMVVGGSSSNEYAIGTTFTLTCTAQGVPQPRVEWIFSGPQRPNVQVSGGQLRITNLQRENAGEYICRAVNEYGSTDTRVTILVTGNRPAMPVTAAGAATLHEALPGSRVVMTCESRTPGATAIWSRLGRLSISTPHEIDRSTLTLLSIRAEDAGRYECRLRNEYGESDPLQHTVSIIGDRPGPPEISGTSTARLGGEVQLRCFARGVPTPTYEWTRSGGLPLPRQSRVDSATGQLIIRSLQAEDVGTYTCTAQNSFGSSWTAARIASDTSGGGSGTARRLEISSRGVRANGVDTDTFLRDTNLTITCRAVGEGLIRVEWQRNGRLLVSESSPGQAVLHIRNLRPEDSGAYECRAFIAGLDAVAVRGEYVFSVPAGSAPTSVRVTASGNAPSGGGIPVGGTLQLTCEANGSPSPSYAWSKYNGAIPSSAIIDGNKFVIRSIQESHQGTYVCMVSNGFGRAEGAITISLIRTPNRRYLVNRHK